MVRTVSGDAPGPLKGCIAIPRVIVRDGRRTGFGKVVVWGGAAIVLVMLVVANLTEGYVAYGNS